MTSVGATLISRRAFLRTATTGTAALALAGTVGTSLIPSGAAAQEDGVSAAAVGPFRTTAALNLRSQPNTSAAILLVIPYQAEVNAIGPEQNGFINVSYGGKTGWAHGDFLTVSSGGGNEYPPYLGTGKTTAAVNLRSGAGPGFGVKRVIPAGATVDIYDEVANNYRLVSYAGQFGYVFADYLSAGGAPTGQLKTTAALNLRAQPSLSGAVLKVIPLGATVQATNQIQNGYRKITHLGTTGWASVAFLK